MSLILASQSRARRAMLSGAGLSFDARAADLDEAAIMKAALAGGAKPAEIAARLAAEKALFVARENPVALVIGSDQVLTCGGDILSKAATPEEAKDKLRFLKGRTHELISAVAVARGEEILWSHSGRAALQMRDFDEDFLARYAAVAGEALTRSVGAYELESVGAQLFDSVEGDYFTVLGMPLLPLLKYLREAHGVGL